MSTFAFGEAPISLDLSRYGLNTGNTGSLWNSNMTNLNKLYTDPSFSGMSLGAKNAIATQAYDAGMLDGGSGNSLAASTGSLANKFGFTGFGNNMNSLTGNVSPQTAQTGANTMGGVSLLNSIIGGYGTLASLSLAKDAAKFEREKYAKQESIADAERERIANARAANSAKFNASSTLGR